MREKCYIFTISLSSMSTLGLALTPETSFLTAQETEALVHEIDSVCGDTWCTGDLDFRFDQLVCNSNECYLDIQVITRNEQVASQSRPHRCQLNNFHSASDLMEIITRSDGRTSYEPTQKLLGAVSFCVGNEDSDRYPLVYVPNSSTCRDSLRKHPLFNSAAYSVYAEIFTLPENKHQPAAAVLKKMVQQFASQDPSCTLQYYSAFPDEISCTSVDGQREICSLPTDLGPFLVIKDGINNPSVIYIEQK